MREWNDPWNPFNSAKVLLWREWLEGCAKGDFLPPVTSDIDMSRHCNFRCPHCNAWRVVDNKQPNLPLEHWKKVSDCIADWGVKSSCLSGGGEPLTHPDFSEFAKYQWFENGIENGVITNGSLLKKKDINDLAVSCRWIGFSVDAATPETFMKIKGLNNPQIFYTVIDNLEKLSNRCAQADNDCDTTFKFLITPDNAHELYEAAELAKKIGVVNFHARPVGFDNIKPLKGLTNEAFNRVIDVINKQIEAALELEDENFHVYGIRHKFKLNLERKISFKKCRATPLLVTFGADGNVHLCFDMRGRKDMILANHYPDPCEVRRVWNTDKHHKTIESIDPAKCPRCTFGPYNEIIEKVIIEDRMTRNFP